MMKLSRPLSKLKGKNISIEKITIWKKNCYILYLNFSMKQMFAIADSSGDVSIWQASLFVWKRQYCTNHEL